MNDQIQVAGALHVNKGQSTGRADCERRSLSLCLAHQPTDVTGEPGKRPITTLAPLREVFTVLQDSATSETAASQRAAHCFTERPAPSGPEASSRSGAAGPFAICAVRSVMWLWQRSARHEMGWAPSTFNCARTAGDNLASQPQKKDECSRLQDTRGFVIQKTAFVIRRFCPVPVVMLRQFGLLQDSWLHHELNPLISCTGRMTRSHPKAKYRRKGCPRLSHAPMQSRRVAMGLLSTVCFSSRRSRCWEVCICLWRA